MVKMSAAILSVGQYFTSIVLLDTCCLIWRSERERQRKREGGKKRERVRRERERERERAREREREREREQRNEKGKRGKTTITEEVIKR